jgi:DNA-binding Xre family transcriptional regulator
MEIKHKSSVKAIIYMIDNCGMSPSDIENRTKISRTQVYRWRDGTVKNVRTSSLHNVAKALGFTIHHIDNKITTTRNSADNTVMKGETKIMSLNHYEKLVNYQENEITRQKKRINQLERDLKHKEAAKNETWYDLCKEDYYMESEVQILPFKGRIVKTDGIIKLANYLGYTHQEFTKKFIFMNKWFHHGKSPLDKIIDKETKTRLMNEMKDFPDFVRFLKMLSGNHFATIKSSILGKDNKPHEIISLIKVKVNSPNNVTCKIKNMFKDNIDLQ